MHGYGTPRDTGISVKPISVSATRAIVEFAFELAKRHRRRKVTLGHKANIMKFSDGVWLETGLRLADGYRDVGFEAIQVDELAMWLRSEEHTSELQSRQYLVCRLLLEKKK